MKQTVRQGNFPNYSHKATLLLILLLYLLLTMGYSILNPLFEAPDEHFHFFTINGITNSGQLPVMPENYDELLGPEPAQPPLYYLLAALLTLPFDTTEARQQVQLNPFAWIGSAEAVVNLNRTLITPWEQWPWQGYALAGHAIRALSTLLGLGTLLCIYASARLLWPQDGRLALTATTLAGFLPQFNFIHAAITNDTLITFLASAGVWQLLRLWQTGLTRQRLLTLGITIGLAALAKNAGILLLMYALGVLFLLALRDYDARQSSWQQVRRWGGETAVYLILPVLLIAGWLWLRNDALYGDFTATNQFIEIAGGDRGYTLWQVLAESGGLWLSFFAVFGWFNLLAPAWVYAVWNGIFLAAVVGLVWAAFRQLPTMLAHLKTKGEPWLIWLQRQLAQPWLPGWLLFGWLLAVYAGLVTFMLQTEAAQGRLLFPAIVPIALGVAVGLSQLRSPFVYGLAGTAALITTLVCLFGVIAPAYALPQSVATLPAEATPLQAELAEGILLVGAEVETETAVPGDIVWFTLYWQTTQPITTMPALKFELLGQDLTNPIGQIHTFHGRGLYPPTYWPTNQIMADRFPVRLNTVIDAPVLARSFVRLVPLSAENEANLPSAFAGALKITPAEWPAPTEIIIAQLGEQIELTAVSLSNSSPQHGETIQIEVTWQATGNPGQDYATLIHLGLAGQPPLAQGDAHPRQGSYPSRLWADGETITDQYSLTIPESLPTGCYPLWIGMYNPADGIRLPLTVAGERQPHDAYPIGDLCVEQP